MQFYRPFTRPQAIGFDLDDTLYNNAPILNRAEQELHEYLCYHFKKTAHLSIEHWKTLRLNTAKNHPQWQHDVSQARLASLKVGLLACGYSEDEASNGSKQALAHFLYWRNKITIGSEVEQLLQQLSHHYPLFVITNGNADITQLGIAKYFQFSLSACAYRPMKPASTLFSLAQQRLNLSGNAILYIGDHPISDIQGSNNMGWQSGWYNPNRQRFDHYKKSLQLPTFEFHHHQDLALLIDSAQPSLTTST